MGSDAARKEFYCPLCKAICNSVVPIAWTDRTEEMIPFGGHADRTSFASWMSSRKSENSRSGILDLPKFGSPESCQYQFSTSNVAPHLSQVWEEFLKQFCVAEIRKAKRDFSEINLCSFQLLNILNTVYSRLELPHSWKSLVSVICCTASVAEISARDEPEVPLLELLNYRTISLLRLLCEFAQVYSCSSSISQSLYYINTGQLNRRISGSLSMLELREKNLPPVLKDDAFSLFVEFSLALLPKVGYDSEQVLQWLTVFYYLNVMQSCASLAVNAASSQTRADKAILNEDSPVKFFFDWFISRLGYAGGAREKILNACSSEEILRYCAQHALPFLRKCEVIIVCAFGYLVNDEMLANPRELDLEYYSRKLGLPSLTSILSSHTDKEASVFGMTKRWCMQFERYTRTPEWEPKSWKRRLTGRFQLASLPHNFETLYESSFGKACSSCGNLPSIPSLCILCGELVRGCCRQGQDCLTHSCSGEAKLFVMVRVCAIFAIYANKPKHLNPPYLDKYGEVDLGLRYVYWDILFATA